MTHPRVSVIVACTRPERIAGLAASLAADGSVPCELVVVGDVGALPAAGWPVPTTLIRCDDRHPNRRRSQGIAVASAPVLAFLDDDAVARPGWLTASSALSASALEVWTGPEQPVRATPGARRAWRVSTNVLAEGSRAHIETRDRPVQWYEVPFCNLVTTRRVLDLAGLPDPQVPWDVDDFEWCRRAAGRGATFRNRADLEIEHDRYPDRFSGWLLRKGVERRRTGEKLVHHPAIYLRVPSVVAGAAAPWLLLAGRALPRALRRPALVVGAATYVGAVAVSCARDGDREPDARAVGDAVGLVALHAVSVSAMQVGLLRALARRARGRSDPWTPAPAAP